MENVIKNAKADAKKASADAKKDPETRRAETIIQKYKGIKNRINNKPSIAVHGTSTVSSHTAGDEHVHQ